MQVVMESTELSVNAFFLHKFYIYGLWWPQNYLLLKYAIQYMLIFARKFAADIAYNMCTQW